MQDTIRTIALAAFSVLLAACGGGGSSSDSSGSSSSYPKLRLANATASTSLVLNAAGISDDDVTFTTGTVVAGGTSTYQQKENQSYTVGVSSTDGSLIGSTQTLSLSAETDYTLLGYARAGSVGTYTLFDEFSTPSSGFSTLAVANAASDAGTLDVYLVAPGASLGGASPAYATLYSKSTSSGKSQTAGTYDVVVTAVGKPADVRLTVPSLKLAGGEVVTLALTSTQGGGLVDGAVVHQGGSMALYPSTKARVRSRRSLSGSCYQQLHRPRDDRFGHAAQPDCAFRRFLQPRRRGHLELCGDRGRRRGRRPSASDVFERR